MEKTINIGNKPVRFKTNGLALLIYKRETGRDLIPDLFSLCGGKKEIEDVNAGKSVDIEKLDVEAIMNIAYVFARIADNAIGARDEWLASFDSFPISDVIEELIPLVIECITTDAKVKNQLATAGLNQKAKFSKRKKSFWLPRKRA